MHKYPSFSLLFYLLLLLIFFFTSCADEEKKDLGSARVEDGTYSHTTDSTSDPGYKGIRYKSILKIDKNLAKHCSYTIHDQVVTRRNYGTISNIDATTRMIAWHDSVTEKYQVQSTSPISLIYTESNGNILTMNWLDASTLAEMNSLDLKCGF